ncbi:MAG TPA: glutamine--fructose-6-phosphate aminotransferase, partial [Chloroflexi bacterium]|nr:glutamine--fructose-6-phosphate aminotransferase [Chloroflexota bacterium]
MVCFSKAEPDKLVAARIGNAGGVVIGLGEGETYIASDLPAILEHTRRVIFLESQQMAVVTKDGATILTLGGEAVSPEVQSISWDPVAAEKGEFRHFMHKEIHEQVRSLTDTISGRVDFDTGHIRFPQLKLKTDFACAINKIFITACGTAAYAGMVGKILIEKLARIPVELTLGSEFRYSDPIVSPNDVVLSISQSGETADTLAAMDEGRQRGATLWSIVNAIGSQAMRVADGYISMQTGPEIGVASTKAYTAPLVDLYMLAILLADLRGAIDGPTRYKLVQDLRRVPDLASQCLDREAEVEAVAHSLLGVKHALYLGRGINMPTAYEGALKLKEISYIHA